MKIHISPLHRAGTRATCAPNWRNPVSNLLTSILSATLVMLASAASGDVVITPLHSFQVFTNGGNPNGLVFGNDGNLYGTTWIGGANGAGNVFKITTNGSITSLYSFANSDGAPQAGLVQGADGNFYGTTSYSSVPSSGTVFKISANGVYTNLYSFDGGSGQYPHAALVQGIDGSLYGTTWSGGAYTYYGTVFKVTTNGAFSILHSFTGGSDGGGPMADLVLAADGYFYGTTTFGTVFQINSSGALTNIYSLDRLNDGGNLWAGLVQGTDGFLYGTTSAAGPDGFGTVFKIGTNGAFARLYAFSGGDGAAPQARLVQGNDGAFYGTTSEGGAINYGTVFKITSDGVFTSLYSFAGTDGARPNAALVRGPDGAFYGTTQAGGVDGYGTVFKIATNGVLNTLYSFPGFDDGRFPGSELVEGDDGNFYGTAGGGYYNHGSAYKITPDGVLTRLYAFSGGRTDGADPTGLMKGSDGDFYGACGDGGDDFAGTVFKITSTGAFTRLSSLSGGGTGARPSAGLVEGTDGTFYGSTITSGGGGYGTLFNLTAGGFFTLFHTFTGGADGGSPTARLIEASDGNFYGTTLRGPSTNGTVFNITADGVLTTLHTFSGGDGSRPFAQLIEASDGNFYGTTSVGGAYANGTVFKIAPDGTFTSLYSFTGKNDGAIPYGRLLQVSDGVFYGTTSAGGRYFNGTIFRITAAGALTSLYSFTGGNDGANPNSTMVRGSDGYFYGAASGGGSGKVGIVYRVAIVPAFRSATLTNGILTLTWSTEIGFKYQLQYNSGFNPANWLNLGNPVTAADELLSATDFVTENPRRFYRVLLLAN